MRAVEMGATWFNDIHVSFRNLLSELGLEHFEQFMTGTSYFEAFSAAPAGNSNSTKQSSYRVTGGTAKLIETLKIN
jgi:monoamine oxidase